MLAFFSFQQSQAVLTTPFRYAMSPPVQSTEATVSTVASSKYSKTQIKQRTTGGFLRSMMSLRSFRKVELFKNVRDVNAATKTTTSC